MSDRLNKSVENTSVEFAQEFGDVNSSKFFEYPFMNQKKQQHKEKKRKK